MQHWRQWQRQVQQAEGQAQLLQGLLLARSPLLLLLCTRTPPWPSALLPPQHFLTARVSSLLALPPTRLFPPPCVHACTTGQEAQQLHQAG